MKGKKFVLTLASIASALCLMTTSTSSISVSAGTDDANIIKHYSVQNADYPVYSSLSTVTASERKEVVNMYGGNNLTDKFSVSLTRPKGDSEVSTITGNYKIQDSGNTIFIEGTTTMSGWFKNNPRITTAFKLGDNLMNAAKNGYLLVNFSSNVKRKNHKSYLAIQNGTINNENLDYLSSVSKTYSSSEVADSDNYELLSITMGQDKGVSGYTGTGNSFSSNGFLAVFYNEYQKSGDNGIYVNCPTLTISSSDVSSPVVSWKLDNTEWSSENKKVYIYASDNQSGLQSVKVNGNNATKTTDGDGKECYAYTIDKIGIFTIEVVDNVGNVYTQTIPQSEIKIDKDNVSKLKITMPVGSHTRTIEVNVDYEEKGPSQETVYYTLDGTTPTTSSSILNKGVNILEFYDKPNANYVLKALLMDEAGHVTSEDDMIVKEFRMDDTRYKVDVTAIHGSFEILGATIGEGEDSYHAWYGDLVTINYLPDSGYEFYKLYNFGKEEGSKSNSGHYYTCNRDMSLEIKNRFRLNIESYEDEYTFEESKFVEPSYTLNTSESPELNMTITKDGTPSSLYNIGDYVVEWKVDNDEYIGSGVMYIKIKPILVTIEFGDNSNLIYNGNVQNLNYTFFGTFDYDIKYVINDAEVQFKNAGNYSIEFVSNNENYVFTNGVLTCEIFKRTIDIEILNTEFSYSASIQNIEYLSDGVDGVVVYTQNDSTVDFLNSGDYAYTILPVDEENYIFTNNTGVCSISRVSVYFDLLQNEYDYTAQVQNLNFRMVDENLLPIDFVNGLTITFKMGGVETSFQEPGDYEYLISTSDTNYDLFYTTGNCSIVIVKVNIVLDRVIYEYTGDEIDFVFHFENENGETTNFKNIEFKFTQNGSDVSPVAVGVYTYTFFTSDVNYELLNYTGEIEIIVAKVTIEVVDKNLIYDENGNTLLFVATSIGGNDYTNNSFIQLTITQNSEEKSLLDVGTYDYEIVSLDGSIVLDGDVFGQIVISPKPISIINIVSQYTYTGSEIIFEYELEQDINVSLQIDTLIDVDDYNYTFTSLDSNYVVANGQGVVKVIPKVVNVTILNNDYTYNKEVQEIEYSLTEEIEHDINTFIGENKIDFKNAGTYRVEFISLNKNYVIESSDINLTIKQKLASITASNLIQTYGKDVKNILVTVEDNVEYKVTFERTPMLVGNYPFEIKLLNNNYTGVYNGVLKIEKKEIKITALAGQYKIYRYEDGDIKCSVEGVFDGDSVNYSVAREFGENVGVYKINLVSFESDNYSCKYVEDFYSIKPRQLVIRINNLSKIYGENDPTLSYEILRGEVVSGDNLGINLERVAGENVGSYDISMLDDYNENYKVLASKSKFTILPKDLVVNINNIETRYSEVVELSYSIEGSYDQSQITGEIEREVGENVGEYVISQGTLSSQNYNLIVNNGKYVILPRELYITALTTTKTYGEEDNLQYVVSNLCDGDLLTGNLEREIGENVGEYIISLGTLNNSNYHINFTSGKLIILKAGLEIIIDDKEQVYGEECVPMTYSINGLKYDDTLELKLFRDGGNDVGVYCISTYMQPLQNYYISSLTTGSYEIVKADIVPTLEGKTVIYNGKVQSLSSEFPFELKYEYSLNGSVVESPVNVGTYSVVAIFEGNQNYNPSRSSVVRLVIKKMQISFVLAENEFIYDGTMKEPEFYFDENCGLNKDSVMYIFEDNLQPIEVGEYKFTIKVTDNNFDGEANGILKIANALTISNENSIIECVEGTFDSSIQALNMVATASNLAVEEKNVVSSFKFENVNNEVDYVYTVKIKAMNIKNPCLYQVVDGERVEVSMKKEGDYYVFRTNNLNGEFFITKDKMDKAVVNTIILGAGIVLLGVLVVTLKVVKARKVKKSKISDKDLSNYDIG
ncbi:MAG: hypothetical protein E7345_02660 [Clostridiales bacterium]|nr:hypothetical protein [Clostridiales bacterium]